MHRLFDALLFRVRVTNDQVGVYTAEIAACRNQIQNRALELVGVDFSTSLFLPGVGAAFKTQLDISEAGLDEQFCRFAIDETGIKRIWRMKLNADVFTQRFLQERFDNQLGAIEQGIVIEDYVLDTEMNQKF